MQIKKSPDNLPYWETKSLQEMNREEWESLCDGCGRCCLIKLEDEVSDKLAETNVVCRYFNNETCRCNEYKKRSELVPECLTLSPDNLEDCYFAPPSCAYRILAEGRKLPNWHPLIYGSDELMCALGISIYGIVISEEFVHEDQLESHIIDWLDK